MPCHSASFVFHFKGLGKIAHILQKFAGNLRVGGELILKEALSRDILAHFPQWPQLS
jgi:hypothetical protein